MRPFLTGRLVLFLSMTYFSHVVHVSASNAAALPSTSPITPQTIEPAQIWRVDTYLSTPEGYGVGIIEAVCTNMSNPVKGHFMALSREDEDLLRKSERFIVMERSSSDWLIFLVPSGRLISSSARGFVSLSENR